MNDRKKILHVVNISFVLPYYLGDQIDYFQKNGFDIYIVCSPSKHLEEFGIQKKIIFLPVEILRGFGLYQDLIAVFRITRFIRKHNIDIVVGHTPKAAFLGLLAAKLSGVKNRFYFRHGIMYETSKGFKRFFLKSIEQFTGYISRKTICVSNSVLVFSEKNKLSSPRKNQIIGKGTCNGINSEYFNPFSISNYKVQQLKELYGLKNVDFVVGYVGRLVKDKGIEELISAWQIVKTKIRNAKLLLVGPVEKRDSISKETHQLISKDNSIIVTGLKLDVKNFYSLMNVFILPSYREGFPTVVLEASSMELPIITTKNTGCIDSIIENKTGIFIEMTNESIVNGILYYVNNPEKRILHGRNGREFVINNFNQKIIWHKLKTIYQEVY